MTLWALCSGSGFWISWVQPSHHVGFICNHIRPAMRSAPQTSTALCLCYPQICALQTSFHQVLIQFERKPVVLAFRDVPNQPFALTSVWPPWGHGLAHAELEVRSHASHITQTHDFSACCWQDKCSAESQVRIKDMLSHNHAKMIMCLIFDLLS